MKNTIFYLLLIGSLWLIPIQNLFSQTTTYTFVTNIFFEDVLDFDVGEDEFGLQVNSSLPWKKATVDVITLEEFKFNTSECKHNDPLTLYKAFVTENNTGLQHKGEASTMFKHEYEVACKDDGQTDSEDFLKDNAFVAYLNKKETGDFYADMYMPVKVVLTLEGGLKLSDVKRISVPGKKRELSAKDFVKEQGYMPSHDCYNNNKGVCAELNKVRSIPDLNKTDVIIQAHRGIWGQPAINNNTASDASNESSYQENTIGAMAAAKTKGYKLLESDIMPIAVSNYTDPNAVSFGVPGDLAAFHDFILTRYTSASSGYIFESSRDMLSNLSLKKPRSENLGKEKIMFFDELINYAADNDLIVCVDMKNLESKGTGDKCTQLCDWQTQERKNISLYQNLKYAINSTPENKLKNIVIKTYAKYDELKKALTTGLNAVSEVKFDKVLWAPLIAKNPQWEITKNKYDVNKIQKFLGDWFAHNEAVLYYETNFFNDFDGETSVMLSEDFCFLDSDKKNKCGNVMEYIYNMTGRRAGIFSEEPVGSRGTVNRWGKWKIKNPDYDRRGDHIWLLSQPFFKHAVITTDRPDIWDQLKN